MKFLMDVLKISERPEASQQNLTEIRYLSEEAYVIAEAPGQPGDLRTRDGKSLGSLKRTRRNFPRDNGASEAEPLRPVSEVRRTAGRRSAVPSRGFGSSTPSKPGLYPSVTSPSTHSRQINATPSPATIYFIWIKKQFRSP